MKALLATVIRLEGYLPVAYIRWFQFQHAGNRVAILLSNLGKGIQVEDNSNALKLEKSHVTLREPVDVMKRGYIAKIGPVYKDRETPEFEQLCLSWEHKKGGEIFISEVYYTDFLIYLEMPEFRREVFEDDAKRKRYDKKVIEALNHFIYKYNAVVKHGNVRHMEAGNSDRSFVLKQGFFTLTKPGDFDGYLRSANAVFGSTNITLRTVGQGGMIGVDPGKLNEHTAALDHELTTPLTTEDEFLSHALEQAQTYHNYKFGLLEAFFAIEQRVQQFLDEHKERAGIPKKNLNEFQGEAGIGYKMNIEIPLALGKIDAAGSALLERMNKIRKIRNEVVHRGRSVTAEECKDAINVIYSFINYLKQAV